MDAEHPVAYDPERSALEALDREDYERTLEVLMDAYGVETYRFCCQMVGREADPEEAHQTTFLQAFQGLPRFRRGSTLRTWLYSIARHRCLDLLKREGVRRLPDEVAARPPEPSGLPGPEGGIMAAEVRRVLNECLAKLDPKIREAVLLRYQQDLPYKEMSEICGDRPATLQARVARALPALRRCVELAGITLAEVGK